MAGSGNGRAIGAAAVLGTLVLVAGAFRFAGREAPPLNRGAPSRPTLPSGPLRPASSPGVLPAGARLPGGLDAAESGPPSALAAASDGVGTTGFTLLAVAEEDGAALAGTRLLDDRKGIPADAAAESGVPDGRISVLGVAAGHRRIFVGAPGRATRATEFDVVPGRVTDLGTVRLALAGRVAGLLRGAHGEFPEGLTLHAEVMPGFQRVADSTVDAEGRFLLDALPPGVVVVEVEGDQRRGWIETVQVPAGGAAAVETGGPVSLEGLARGPGGSAADYVAVVPCGTFSDALAVIGPLAHLHVAGLRAVWPKEDGAYTVSNLPPGLWLVANRFTHRVVTIPEAATEPVHADLLPLLVTGRVAVEGTASLPVIHATALPADAVEPALSGKRRRMMNLVLAAWRGEQAPVSFRPVEDSGTPVPDFAVPVPDAGRYLVFLHADGYAAEGPLALEAREGAGPPGAVALLRPAATVRVTIADAAPEEVVAVVARDARGEVVSFRSKEPPVAVGLLPGIYRVQVLRGGGRKFEREIVVPDTGVVDVEARSE